MPFLKPLQSAMPDGGGYPAEIGGSGSGPQFSSSCYVVPVLGMAGVHIIYSFCTVLSGWILAAGVDPLFAVYSAGIASFFFLAPFAACVERRKWPERVGGKLTAQFVLISIGGVTAFQVLTLMGLQRTSPAVASAMSSMSPGLIFLLACCLKFEKFDIKCRYSASKAVGTLLCLGGVIAMTLLQQSGKSTDASPSPPVTGGVGSSLEWIAGCVYLFSANFIMSCTTILQAAAMEDFEAPMSMTSITSLMGGLFTAAIQFLSKGKLDLGNYTISTATLAMYVLLASSMMSVCFAFQMWCIRQQGPVFVAMFSPIGTVTSAVLSAMVLGKFLTPGSLVGVSVMIVGLYTVLWAKRKECLLPLLVDYRDDQGDVEKNEVVDDNVLNKPLLS